MNSLDDVGSMVNWTYGHDANGNLTSRSDGTDTWRYTWDDENRLIQVEKNSTTQASYQYDSNSRLIQRVAAGTTTNYTWDGWDLVKEEKSGTITETTRYAVPQGMITSFDRNGSRYYLHGDGLSSTQLVTDGNGAQAARVVYGAWGDTLSSNDSVPGGLDVRFVGGLGVRNDSTTGLIYMRHRWYDAGVLGRFISRDPIGHNGGLNLYSYPTNPVKYSDPSGLIFNLYEVSVVLTPTGYQIDPTSAGTGNVQPLLDALNSHIGVKGFTVDTEGNLVWPEGLEPRNDYERKLKEMIEDDDVYTPIGVCNSPIKGNNDADGGIYAGPAGHIILPQTLSGGKLSHELFEAHAESRDNTFYLNNPGAWSTGPHFEGIYGENAYYRSQNSLLRRMPTTGSPEFLTLPGSGSCSIPFGK